MSTLFRIRFKPFSTSLAICNQLIQIYFSLLKSLLFYNIFFVIDGFIIEKK